VPRKSKDIKPVSIGSDLYCARVARYWNLKPWEFRELKPRESGELCAVYDIDKEIESYYHDQIDAKHDADKRRAEHQQYGRR